MSALVRHRGGIVAGRGLSVVSLVGLSMTRSASGGGGTITPPSGRAAGDLLLAASFVSNNNGATGVPAAGWTNQVNITNSSSRGILDRRTADTTTGDNYAVPSQTAAFFQTLYAILRMAGSPTLTYGSGTLTFLVGGGSGNFTVGSVTAPGPGTDVILLAADVNGTSPAVSIPSGFTRLGEASLNGGADYAAVYARDISAGATGTTNIPVSNGSSLNMSAFAQRLVIT